MSQDSEDADDGLLEPPPPPKRNRRRLLAIVAAIAIVVAAAGAAAWFMKDRIMALAGYGGAAKESTEVDVSEKRVLIDVPAIVVNIRSSDGSSHFLKLRFVIVAGKKATEAELRYQLPLLIDTIQPFLRELRPDDLAGSAAVFRIKEEVRLRAVSVLGPDMISDILIQDLVQE
jgi:flagellar FliL protein